MVYAISPLIYNLGIILGIIFLYPIFGLYGLALGVVFGAFGHMVIQLPFMLGRGIFPRFTTDLDWKSVKKIVLISLPRTLTLSSSQLASFFLVSLASIMTSGGISIFSLALNLQSVPLTIIGVSYSSAIFPSLSKYFVNGENDKFIDKIVESSRHIIFWSVPITVLFVVLRAQIVRTIYGAGAFDWVDTRLTAATLAIFVISVTAQSLILLFVRASYARGKTFIPLSINIFSSLTIALLGYIFLKSYKVYPVFNYFLDELFKVSDLHNSGTHILVLPLAYTIGTLINLVLYWYICEKDYKGFSSKVLPSFFQSFAGSVIMGYVTFISLRFFNMFFPLTKLWGVFLQGFCAGIVGIMALIIILRLLQNKELKEVWETLHHKIWKAKVIIPGQENL
jgi:putative peptidoglycan lipid II flippase